MWSIHSTLAHLHYITLLIAFVGFAFMASPPPAAKQRNPNMDWNSNLRPPFLSRHDNSFPFLYTSNYDPYPGVELKCPMVADTATSEKNYNGSQQEKKRRLRSDQLESLEKSFQEEIKLEPERKMKLAHELGLHPRQIAVWFQNRRARWKTKQLERLYDTLKLEFDVVSKEKQRLQEEVMKLKATLKKQTVRKPTSEMSGGEETVESTTEEGRKEREMGESCNYAFNVDDLSSSPYWPLLPSFP